MDEVFITLKLDFGMGTVSIVISNIRTRVPTIVKDVVDNLDSMSIVISEMWSVILPAISIQFQQIFCQINQF